MKPHRLTTPFLSATLFLAATAFGQSPSATPGASSSSPDTAPLLAPPSGQPKLSARDLEILKRFDTNGDGKIDENELVAAHESMYRVQEEREVYARRIYDQLLERFDKEHKGSLSPAQQVQALAYIQDQLPEAYDRILKRFDRQGDRKLTPDETTAVFQYLSNIPSVVVAAPAPPSSAGGATASAPAAKPAAKAGQAANVRRLYTTLLQRFDKDHKGSLSPAEQAQALAFIEENRPGVYQTMVQRFDKDGDGRLSADEAAAMFAQLEKLSGPIAAAKPTAP